MAYPGGKNGAGVYQTLINLIPPHHTYIETHLGGGAVMRHKRPAQRSVGIDIDPEVVEGWSTRDRKDLTVINGDAVQYLKQFVFTGCEFVYCDPPYLIDKRSSRRKIYKFEYDRSQHVVLIKTLLALPCMVMVSGYWSRLYDDAFSSWNSLTFEAQTRGGSPATEYVWFNYPEPDQLHDYSYLGSNFRERERIKRKKARWVNRIKKMDVLERRALFSAISQATEASTAINNDAGSHRRE